MLVCDAQGCNKPAKELRDAKATIIGGGVSTNRILFADIDLCPSHMKRLEDAVAEAARKVMLGA